MFVDHWWVMLQLGLSIVASVRGWGFTPWGLWVFTFFLSRMAVSMGIAFFAGVFWPDLLLTALLFFLVIVPPDEQATATRSQESL